jgi:hypothetical protein
MAKLSEAEKQELLDLSRSPELREDMRILRENRQVVTNNIDMYIQFLNETNELIDHRPKKFKEIKGEIFLL